MASVLIHAQRLPLDLRLPHRSLCYAQIKKASARHNALARWRVRLPIRTRDTYERTYLTLHEMSLTGRSPSMGWMDGPERRISAMKSIALEFSAEDPEIAEAFFRRALDVERERLASSEGLKSANVLRDIARVVNFSRMDVKRRSRILAAILTGIGQAGAFDASALDIVMMLARTDAEGALSMAWRMQEDFSQDEGEYALGYISMLREYLLRGANENASLGQPLPVRKARSLFLLGPLSIVVVELAKTGMELTLVLAQSPPLASCLLEGFVRQARWDAAAFPKRAKTMIPRAALVVPTLLPLDPVADMEIDMRARLFYETDYFPDLSVLRTRYRLLLGLVTLSVNQPVETAWHFLDFCRQAAGTLENPDRAALLTAMAEARTAMIASL